MSDEELYLDELDEDDFLIHYGKKRRSGRYEYGSGEIPYQHEPWFKWETEVDKYLDQGMSRTEVAKAMGMSTNEFRQRTATMRAQRDAQLSAAVWEYKQQGRSNAEIARRMGINGGTVSRLLNIHENVKAQKFNTTANLLKQAVAEKKYIDVSEGTEVYLGIKKTKLDSVLRSMKEEGYFVDNIYVEQNGNRDKKTTTKVLAPPGTTKPELYQNLDKISFPGARLADDGLSVTSLGLRKPESLDSKRLEIKYAEQGGSDKDGVIELRRGVPDISLGNSLYAQVRIAVDGSHYLKGMAVYSDDLPPGVDVRFNTSKHEDTPMMSSDKDHSVLKPMKTKINQETGEKEVDWDNPFGATVKDSITNEKGMLIGGQREYIDKNGEKKLSVINKVNDEGDWDEWTRSLPSQMLAKQPEKLAKQQLDIAYKEKRMDLDEIKKLTNPEVKKKMLEDFADNCDVAASELRGAAMPRQAAKVILPLTTLKDNEIYAPTFKDGERVVLIRFPHAGRMEIPELIVNNKNAEGNAVITKQAPDAVGIPKKAAAKLSGADFDGDTVLVIPNNNNDIKTIDTEHGPSSRHYKQLANFDPKEAYPGYTGMKRMTAHQKGIEMGKITNLITDMQVHGASDDKIVRAIKHSMVIIDAEKHGLDWRTSEIQNGIQQLRDEYQNVTNPITGGKGAATLLSRANADVKVDQVYDRYKIDPDTGKKIYTETGKTYKKFKKDKNGNVVLDSEGNPVYKEHKKLTERTQMDLVDDAYKLSSGSRIETVYAEHANKLKAMANEARKEMIATKGYTRSSSAAETYKEEVDSLMRSLDRMVSNSPKERMAQRMAKAVVDQKIADNPELKLKENKEQLKRINSQAVTAARLRVGTVSRKDREIKITPRQWEAIQAHAVSPTVLRKIMTYADPDEIRKYATPKEKKGLSSTQISTAKAMLKGNYDMSDVAEKLGVSTSTLYKYIKE